MEKQNVIDALAKLDVNNDEHWTQAGAPRIDALKELSGEDISKDDLTEVAPDYSRTNRVAVNESDEPETGDALPTTKAEAEAAVAEANAAVAAAQKAKSAAVAVLDGFIREEMAKPKASIAQMAQKRAESDAAKAGVLKQQRAALASFLAKAAD